MNVMKLNYKFNETMIFLLLLSFCFPNVNLFTIGGQGIKIYRVITLFLFVYIIFKRKTKIPSKKMLLFLIYMIGISIIGTFIYRFERLIIDYIFAFIILLIVYNLSEKIDYEKLLVIIQKVSWIILFLILLNIYNDLDQIVLFLKNPYNTHPLYDSIFTGGANLESTWPGMLALFFINKPRKGIVYVSLCFLISILLSSRAGIIVDLFALMFIMWNKKANVSFLSRKRIFQVFIILLCLVIFVFYFITFIDFADTILNRFINIGNDLGSQGRLRMWNYIFQAFLKNPFGYGAGNAILAVKNVSHLWYGEDNVHNLFFQMMLDFGFIGLVFYISLIIDFFKNGLNKIMSNPFSYFILVYLIVGIIQFKGAEMITFFVIGLYLSLKKREGEVVHE